MKVFTDNERLQFLLDERLFVDGTKGCYRVQCDSWPGSGPVGTSQREAIDRAFTEHLAGHEILKILSHYDE